MAARRGVVIVISLILVAVLVSAAGLVALALVVGRQPRVAPDSTLVLRISGDLQEMQPSGVIGQLFEQPDTVRSVVEMLHRAKIDNRISSVILRPTGDASLWGKVQEVRDAVLDFRQSKKPIVAFLEVAGEQQMYLASACDKIFLAPTASLDLKGLASYELFLRGTLDKIGAYPDALHIGEYKTASNVYTETGYTGAHREMAQSLNRDLYDQLVRGLADGRHKSEEEIRELIDRGPTLPEEAVRSGLIDDLAYEDEIDDKVTLGSGVTRFIEQREYRNAGGPSIGTDSGDRIAIVYAVGLISSGRSGYDSPQGQVVGSDTLVEYLRKARADRSVKAVVLRIDSPGGSAVASDVIWREVLLTRQVKPVIASMSDVAASGGYYIAMPATAIVAQPATLTGSIGVVMVKFVIDGTLSKVGLHMDHVQDGRFADIYSPIRPFTPEEREKLGAQMQATYDTFVEKAAEGRNTTPEKIDAVGQGRVWTGSQARRLGLVDELGGLDRAVALAKERAGIAQDRSVDLVVYPPHRSLYEVMTDSLGRTEGAALAARLGLRDPRALAALTAPVQVFRQGEALALMPNVFAR